MRLLQSRKLCFVGITQCLLLVFRPRCFYFPALSLHSPRCDVRGEADHKRADEGADFLRGPHPSPLLLIQTFLPHTGKSTQAPLLTQGWRHKPGTHAEMVKQSIQVSGARPAAVNRVRHVRAQGNNADYANESDYEFNYLTKLSWEGGGRASNRRRGFGDRRKTRTRSQRASLVISVHLFMHV